MVRGGNPREDIGGGHRRVVYVSIVPQYELLRVYSQMLTWKQMPYGRLLETDNLSLLLLGGTLGADCNSPHPAQCYQDCSNPNGISTHLL
jgi:hypothetical protein